MADLVLTTFDWVPNMPRGFVRDVRVRWALEEAGLPYRVEGVPSTKAELGRRELVKFIGERHAGALEYQESMLDSLQRDLSRRPKRRLPPIPKFRPYPHQLVPDSGHRIQSDKPEVVIYAVKSVVESVRSGKESW